MQDYIMTGGITPAFVNNPTAWVILLVVILLLFGGKNIPEAMKGLGQGLREFKKGMESDEDPPTDAERDREARIRSEIEQEVRARLEAQQQGTSDRTDTTPGSGGKGMHDE